MGLAVLGVTGGADRTVRIWDLAAGRHLGAALTGHAAAVCSVATTTATGRPLAVTAGTDKTVRVWDLGTGEQIGAPGVSHHRWVRAVATTTAGGIPVSVAGAWNGALRVRDLATNRQAGAHPTGRPGQRVARIAACVVGGRPVAVTSSGEGGERVRVWDVTTRSQLGELPVDGVQDLTAGTVHGRPVAVVAGYRMVQVWDLDSYRQIGDRLCFPQYVNAVALHEDGRIVVCFGTDVAVFAGRVSGQREPAGPDGEM